MQNECFNPISMLDSEMNPNIINVLSNKIHIHIKQRNQRKSTTTVENLPSELNLELLIKKMKQKFHCNGCVQKSVSGKYLQFSGDQRLVIKKYLIDNRIIEEENICVHGY